MKTKEKQKENKMTPLSKDDIVSREEALKALAKRFPRLVQDLEVEGLDLILYAKSLSEGRFPATHLVQVENSLTKSHTELGRIIKAYKELFDKEIGEKNGTIA